MLSEISWKVIIIIQFDHLPCHRTFFFVHASTIGIVAIALAELEAATETLGLVLHGVTVEVMGENKKTSVSDRQKRCDDQSKQSIHAAPGTRMMDDDNNLPLLRKRRDRS